MFESQIRAWLKAGILTDTEKSLDEKQNWNTQEVKIYYLYSKNNNTLARFIVICLCPLTLSNYIT